MTVRSPLRRLAAEDEGLAVIAVAMLGLALVLFTTMVAFRAQRQADGVRADARWSQALDVAEAGLDDGFIRLESDPGFTTGETLPATFDSPEAAREWFVEVADAKPTTDVRPTSEGEYVVIRPINTAAVFSVGFVPNRGATDRRVRVLRAEVGEAATLRAWEARYAVLSGGDLLMNGNPTIVSGVTVGIHANGYLDLRGSVFVDGCLSASNGASIVGSIVQDPRCAPAGAQAPVLIPVVDPRQFWEFAQFDLCPGGAVKAGPAHPTHGNTANSPCNGATLAADASTVAYRGWTFNGTSASLGARWVHSSSIGHDGVYYVYRGSADVASDAGSGGDPWQVTIIAEGYGACPNTVGGDVEVSGGPHMAPYPGAYNLLIAAGRDVLLSGNPSIVGLVAAHEQVDSGGTPAGDESSILAEDACDSAGDTVDTTTIAGTVTIDNSGPVSSPFPGTEMIPVVVNWNEL